MDRDHFSEDELKKLDRDILIKLYISLEEKFDSLNSLLNDNLAKLQAENQELRQELMRVMELNSALVNHRFGKKSEKIIKVEPEGVHQMDFEEYFNAAEFITDRVYVVEPDVDTVIIPALKPEKPGKKVGKRQADLRGLDVEVISHELSLEELSETFGSDGWKSLPDEIYKKLHYVPASVYVEEHHVKVYAGKDNQTIIRAQRPKDLLTNSLATPSLVAAVMDEKYVKHVPLYRQEQDFLRKGINISRQTMASWVIRTHERYLSLLLSGMREELLKQPVLQADETSVEVTKDGRPAGSESRMWVYRTGRFSEKTIILYDYQKTRAYEHLEKFMSGFRGFLVSDAYPAYEKLDKEHNDITMAACWAHARRRFSEAEKAIGSKKKEELKKSVAHNALQRIAKMYKIEGELSGAPPDERLRIRQEKIKPLIEEFFTWIKQKKDSGEVLPKGKTASGIEYCLNHEPYLKVFLDEPMIPMDNNATEQALRGFCLGRNNWKLIDTISGAEASAGIYSLVETAKANGLIPYKYIEHLLTVLPEAVADKELNIVKDLLPWSEKIPSECRIKK